MNPKHTPYHEAYELPERPMSIADEMKLEEEVRQIRMAAEAQKLAEETTLRLI